MASAQVMRKQGHLEAGKKKLEEFRKKKAAEKAKKATSVVQINVTDDGLGKKQSSGQEHRQLVDSALGSASDSVGASFPQSSAASPNLDVKDVETSEDSSFSFPYVANDKDPDSAVNTNIDSLIVSQSSKDEEFKSNIIPQYSQWIHQNGGQLGKKETNGATESALPEKTTDQYVAAHMESQNSASSSLQSTVLPDNDDYLKDSSGIHSSISHPVHINGFPENSGNVLFDKSDYDDRFTSSLTSSLKEDFMQSTSRNTSYFPDIGHKTSALGLTNTVIADRGEDKLSRSSLISGASNLNMWGSDSSYNGFSSSNYGQESRARRSRPSFLDSINVSNGPSTSTSQPEPVSSKVFPEDTLGPSHRQSETYSSASVNGFDLPKNVMEKTMDDRQEFYSRKQNEDFAALEQHIEDLTQDKFSLQQALEASRTLADSLAAENSALTDSYNQQGSVVHQLKADLENLQKEINANLVELESMKIEYANAQLECNAADERAKLLASEVIGLEEKALRLKSNELKLQRQVESAEAEISSLKKKLNSLEKERQGLQSTIGALQEEKKLLQSMLRKSSASVKLVNNTEASTMKKDVSTSTEDLGTSIDVDSSVSMSTFEASLRDDLSNLPHHQESRQFSLQDMATTIPADQMRMIENINSLLSELALEREELMRSLSVESSQTNYLKELNKELTRKLEVQTQRLELLTAQSMATDGLPARKSDSHLLHENPTYADEGDEVVERVLGWIMKLFPGAPSRRRTSKVL